MTSAAKRQRIVIVGGGAGGLELATRLGDTLGRRQQTEVVLVDNSFTHLWKPLLHEVAAGTLDSHESDMEYLAQARRHSFQFQYGQMDGLDRANKRVSLAPLTDDLGRELAPRRGVPYDLLVIAVGGVTHDFGVPGAREHCAFLDSREQADGFQRDMFFRYLRAQTGTGAGGPLRVAIVGGGATGVELAAELHAGKEQLAAYGFDKIRSGEVGQLVLIETSSRVLAALPERISDAATRELERLNVELRTSKRVREVTAQGLYADDGEFIPAEVKVWAAGVKAPAVLAELDDLETDSRNRLCVTQNLRTTKDSAIFALGDCAACPRPDADQLVPPTAQAAHRQATHLARHLPLLLRRGTLPDYVHRDRGSLVSLSGSEAIGSLMGKLTGNIMIEGRVAHLAYRGLYRSHQRAVHGSLRTLLTVVADGLTRSTRVRTKLH